MPPCKPPRDCATDDAIRLNKLLEYRIKEKDEEIATLHQKITDSREIMARYQSTNYAIRRENRELTALNEKLKAKINAIKELQLEINQIREQRRGLISDKNRLIGELNRTKAENKILKNANEDQSIHWGRATDELKARLKNADTEMMGEFLKERKTIDATLVNCPCVPRHPPVSAHTVKSKDGDSIILTSSLHTDLLHKIENQRTEIENLAAALELERKCHAQSKKYWDSERDLMRAQNEALKKANMELASAAIVKTEPSCAYCKGTKRLNVLVLGQKLDDANGVCQMPCLYCPLSDPASKCTN